MSLKEEMDSERAKEIAETYDMQLIDSRIKSWDEELERLHLELAEAKYEVNNANSYRELFLKAKKIKLNAQKARKVK